MAYIGNKPANKAVVASDLDPAVITGQTALAVAPADTDEFLISDAGVLKRLDASLIGGGGKVLQVVSAIDTTMRSTTSTSYVTASNTLTQSITPSSTSSKILILASVTVKVTASDGYACLGTIFRGGSDIATNANGMLIEAARDSNYAIGLNHISFLDSPSSTSSLTYDFRFKSEDSSRTVQISTGSTQSSFILMEIGA